MMMDISNILTGLLYAAAIDLILFCFGKIKKIFERGSLIKILRLKSCSNKDDFKYITCYLANPDVTSVQEGQNCSNLAFFYEYLAYGEINALFKRLYRIDKSILCRISKLDLKEKQLEANSDIVLIGGPNHNLITKKLFFGDNGKYPFSFDENNRLIYKDSSDIVHEIFPNDNELGDSLYEDDYALLLNVKNPNYKNRRIFLICGCHSLGCYGGAYFLSNNLSTIKNVIKDQDYALIIKCSTKKDELDCRFERYYKIDTDIG